MNLSLLKSVHALFALLLVAPFIAWMILDQVSLGRGPDQNNAFLLTSGWVAFALFCFLAVYAVRKYAHRLGLSPEFRREVSLEQLERTERGIGAIRVRLLSGEILSPRIALKEALAVTKSESTHRAFKPVVIENKNRPGQLALRLRPRQPIGGVAAWMGAHIYFGIAGLFLLWIHGGFALSSPMAITLNALTISVLGTGGIGIVLWIFGPTWLTRNERELSLERTYSLRDHYERKTSECVDQVKESQKVSKQPESKATNKAFLVLENMIRRRGTLNSKDMELLKPLGKNPHFQDCITLIGQFHRVEMEWKKLSRIRWVMNVWRVVHIPATILLLIIIVVHVISITVY